MNVRRLIKLAAAFGVVAVGLSVAPAATAITATPQTKCDPESGMRVTYSSSGEEKVKARGCVQIEKVDDDQWQVTGSVRAQAYSSRGLESWRLAKHTYRVSCEVHGASGLTGFGAKAGSNAANASDGTTEGSCARVTLPSGTYTYTWSYDRMADSPESAVSTDGEVEFTLEGEGAEVILRPLLPW